MSFDLLAVLVVLIVAVGLFLWEKLAPAVVAVLVMAALLVLGIISPADGLRGFSNQATVAVAAMFVLSHALEKTGAVNIVGDYLADKLHYNYKFAWLSLLVGAGVMSGFINNTAVVAILIPILLQSSREAKISPSKLLMPVSFAAMFGGSATLIGTSTNLLVSSIVERHGEPAIDMFEFTAMGALFFAVGLGYLAVVGRWIPERRTAVDELTESFGMGEYLTHIELVPGARAIGQVAGGATLVEDLDCDILDVFRAGQPTGPPTADFEFEEGDILQVCCNVEHIKKLQKGEGFRIKWREVQDAEVEAESTVLLEAAITPYSELDGSSLRDINFREHFNATPLAVRQRGELQHSNIDNTRLRGGDVLLLEVPKGNVEQVRDADTFMVLSQLPAVEQNRTMIPFVLAVIVGVVLVAALDIVPIVVSATAGCVILVISRVLTFEDAIDGIDWNVIFLLAGVLSLGIALEKTGADALLSQGLVSVYDWAGPYAVVSALYIVTALLTSAMSNNATAALLTPIALAAAASLGVDARPLVMAVAFAASASFLTPVGYQTNTMVYGAGHYKFTDFVYYGGPLTLIFWGLATFAIPYFWPFHP